MCVLVTCRVQHAGVAAHTAVLLLGSQSFQYDVAGPETRQSDVGQMGERVLLGEQLARFPPLAKKAALRKQHYPLPVTAVVVFI